MIMEDDMRHVQKILVPLDLTKNSLIGLNFAVTLAEESAANLLALHVANEYQAWQMLDETGFASDRIYRWEVDRVIRESMLDLNPLFGIVAGRQWPRIDDRAEGRARRCCNENPRRSLRGGVRPHRSVSSPSGRASPFFLRQCDR
jgi:hypothetical protein